MPFASLGGVAGAVTLAGAVTASDASVWVRLSDQGEENAEWEGDNRERPIPGVDG